MGELRGPRPRASLIDANHHPSRFDMSGAQSSDDSPSISRLEPGQLSPHHRPRPLPPSSKHTAPAILQNLVPSNSASPPTPAPSPTPQGPPTWWNDAAEDEHAFLRDTRYHFSRLGRPERQRFLAEVLNLCDSRQLSFVHSFVSPRLKKDPFSVLPNELCLRVRSHPPRPFLSFDSNKSKKKTPPPNFFFG